MPSIEWNRETWKDEGFWQETRNGESWSNEWGGSEYQFRNHILPRIEDYLHGDIFEIAQGYGRWTQYLINYGNYSAVDLAQNCVDYCKGKYPEGTFTKNDGGYVDFDDESFDFIFSYDSLVHAEKMVIEIYMNEIQRLLKDGGFAFIHHSNHGQYISKENMHARSLDVDYKVVREVAKKINIKVVSQELINWNRDEAFIDCYTLLTNEDYEEEIPLIKTDIRREK